MAPNPRILFWRLPQLREPDRGNSLVGPGTGQPGPLTRPSRSVLGTLQPLPDAQRLRLQAPLVSFRQPRPAREGLPAKRPPPSCKAQFARVTPGSASAREAPSLPKLLKGHASTLGLGCAAVSGTGQRPALAATGNTRSTIPLFELPLAFLLHPTANDSTCQAAEAAASVTPLLAPLRVTGAAVSCSFRP